MTAGAGGGRRCAGPFLHRRCGCRHISMPPGKGGSIAFGKGAFTTPRPAGDKDDVRCFHLLLDFRIQMKDFRQNDFFHTDLDEARQSRQAVDLALVDDASRRPVGHGLYTAGPAIGKIRHHRLEGRNFLIEQGFHRFDGHVALGQARTAAGDDQVDAADPFMEMAFDFGLVVFDNLIVDD